MLSHPDLVMFSSGSLSTTCTAQDRKANAPEGGGGGGTASLKVGTHCQTTAPEFSLTAPYFLDLDITAL